MNQSTKVCKVLIFGSCVSRDPFSLDYTINSQFELLDYYARSSLSSISTNPPKKILNIDSIDSPFQRKMVEKDINKEFYNSPHLRNSDLILIDFIDDRYNMLLMDGETLITDSPEFRKANIITANMEIIDAFSEKHSIYFEAGWSRFIKFTKSINAHKKIIINKVFWASVDDNGNQLPNQSYIQRANNWLEIIYNRLSLDLTELQFVDYDGIKFIADSSHRWGLAPFHYVQSVETKALNEVHRYFTNTL